MRQKKVGDVNLQFLCDSFHADVSTLAAGIIESVPHELACTGHQSLALNASKKPSGDEDEPPAKPAAAAADDDTDHHRKYHMIDDTARVFASKGS